LFTPKDGKVISLLGPLSGPLAGSAGAVAGTIASAATRPFASFLGAAENDAAGDSPTTPDLESDVAGKLQKLLKSVGVPAGERVTLYIDKKTGAINVDDDQPLAADIEAALRADSELAGNLRRLAKVNDVFHSSSLIAQSEVEATVGDDETASLRWL
jgi:hypothetical protein